MKNFFRIVRYSLRYRFMILAIFVSSIMVGALWVCNIAAVYPFVKVVLQQKSLPQWVTEEIQQLETREANLQTEIASLEDKPIATSSADTDSQLTEKSLELQAAQKDLSFYIRVEPFVTRYLPQSPWRTLVWLVVFIFSGTLIKCVFLVANMFLVRRLAERTTMELRNKFYAHTLQMELSAFGKDHTGTLMSYYNADAAAVTGGISTLFGKSLREPMKMIGCLIGAGMISWQLLVVSLIICPVPLLLMYFLSHSIRRASRRALAQTSLFFERLSETFRGIQVVKAFTMEHFEQSRFIQATRDLYHCQLRVALYGALARANNEILGVGVLSLALLAGGYLILSQQPDILGVRLTDPGERMDVATLMTFFGLLVGISDPARKLADVVAHLQNAVAGSDRIYNMLDRQPAIQDPVHPQALPAGPLPITFDNVTFHYSSAEPLLEQLNLRIQAGETLAVVGPNGCGKSTLVNLILRFYDPLQGCVFLDQVGLKNLKLHQLRQKIGVVTQQTLLFQQSVLENIRYGSPTATNQQVIEASRKAHAHEFITQKLEQGYETMVGEDGKRLSGGQRQRISLARAILRNPDILILDEATSQVDPESEHLIHQVLKKFKQNRTTILITHRGSTLSLADRILVMDAGRIVDLGTEQELIDRCELYAQLYQHEFKNSA